MSVPSSVAAPACAPRQQHKKSAAERRQQSRRAEGRVVQRLLVAFDSIRRHRGNTQGRLARALSFALSAAMRQGSRAFGPALNQVEPRADAPVFSPAPAAAAAVHPPIVVPVDAFTLAQSTIVASQHVALVHPSPPAAHGSLVGATVVTSNLAVALRSGRQGSVAS